MITYRPYQRECIDQVKADWQEVDATLIVAATGSGKTVVFLGLLDEVLQENPTARCLIIAHRKELIEQPIERLQKFWPHLAERAGIVMAEQNNLDKQIIVATVQTLNADGRLDAILQHGAIDYVITDEAHHAVAQTYQSVYARLGSFKHLGVTATPLRADGAGLRQVFQRVSAKYGIKPLIRMGHLAPPRWLAIQTGVSLKGVPKHGSGPDRDYSAKALRNAFEVDNTFEIVVASHQKYAADRPSICFTVSVDGAHELADKFNQAGICAAAADGGTPKDERRAILDRFRAGKTQVLCNVALWTEGLDLPEISCVHMVRPTQSDAYYLQAVGRGLRLFPAKEDALILDYCPVEARNVTMLGDVLGVEAKKEAYLEEKEPGEVAGGFTFDGEVRWMDGNPMEIVSRQLDYLSASPWKWTQPAKTDWLVLGLGKGTDDVERTLAISPPSSTMQLWGIWRGPTDRWASAHLLEDGTFEELTEKGEEIAEKHGTPVLMSKQRSWRDMLPSEGQIKFAKRLKVYDEGMDRGTVAEAITYKLAIQALSRHGATAIGREKKN